MTVDVEGLRLFLAVGFFLAGAHAHSKLSPFFAATWFGAALVFAWFWSGGDGDVESLLTPGLVFYVAAAATKGLVENRERLAGNHVVHVLITGLISGAVVMPLLAGAQLLGAHLPGERSGPVFLSDVPAGWLGHVSPTLVASWVVAGTLFYGVYKILDHVELGKPLQTIAVFVSAAFLPRLVGVVLGG